MTRNHQQNARVLSYRLAALACAFAILLVGTLQATHIHKEWTAPPAAQSSLRVETGTDAPCVFCLGSHITADIPLDRQIAELVLFGQYPVPQVRDASLSSSVWAETIRPPPVA